jgi:hypothetical protein
VRRVSIHMGDVFFTTVSSLLRNSWVSIWSKAKAGGAAERWSCLDLIDSSKRAAMLNGAGPAPGTPPSVAVNGVGHVHLRLRPFSVGRRNPDTIRNQERRRTRRKCVRHTLNQRCSTFLLLWTKRASANWPPTHSRASGIPVLIIGPAGGGRGRRA